MSLYWTGQPGTAEDTAGAVEDDGRAAQPGGLTRRERELLALIMAGRSVASAAEQLSLREDEVWGYVSRIHSKIAGNPNALPMLEEVARQLLEGAAGRK